jgi:hypothetical protein
MFGDVPVCSGYIRDYRPYGGMPLECLQVGSELILCQDPINVPEYRRHESLKGGWRIAVPLLHNVADVRAHNGCECSLIHILCPHTDLVISVR